MVARVFDGVCEVGSASIVMGQERKEMSVVSEAKEGARNERKERLCTPQKVSIEKSTEGVNVTKTAS